MRCLPLYYIYIDFGGKKKTNTYSFFKQCKSRSRERNEINIHECLLCIVYHEFSPVSSPVEILSPTLKIRLLSLGDKSQAESQTQDTL